VRSPGDFDGLDAPGSWVLRPQASPAGHKHASKQKKDQKWKNVLNIGGKKNKMATMKY
jgi:hypothetical protein